MRNALIGHTGLVGSHLAEQYEFHDVYNSSNIESIQGKEYDLVCCAGVAAVKWWSNKNPEEDRSRIDSLYSHLQTISAKRFVLISTVDVYENPFSVNEDTKIELDRLQAYGQNRRRFEMQLAEAFPGMHTVRLPGLFGKRLKKNVLYDMIANNMTNCINPDSQFQWYPLERLWADIEKVIAKNIRTCNLSVEPIATHVIQQRFFPNVQLASEASASVTYDMQSRFGHYFGSNTPYIVSANEMLDAIAAWLQNPMIKHG